MHKKDMIFKMISLFLALCFIGASMFLEQGKEGINEVFPSFAPVYFEPDTAEMLEDLTAYYATNDELVGWVNNKNGINICIMQRDDNEFYLNHNLTMAYSENGTAFMDNRCNEASLNTVIYGSDIGIFSPLLQYSSGEYISSNPSVLYSSLYEKDEYKIYAVIKGSRLSLKDTALSLTENRTEVSKSEFENYINSVTDIASVKTENIPKYGDKLITLCTYSSAENAQCVAVLAYAEK